MKVAQRSVGLVAAATAASLALLSPATAQAATSVPTPANDSFYSYSGPLSGVPNGTILRKRTVETAPMGTAAVLPATQVLYKTTDDLGQPDATVATIFRPLSSMLGMRSKIISYQEFYDGLASTCRPSYQLRIGGTTLSKAQNAVDEEPITQWLAAGYTVVTSDYEGSTDDFGAGIQSGRQTLDGIRATEHLLGDPASTAVGLEGYSGGSTASMWAAQEQPTYAPRLNIRGVAAGGIPVDFAHNLLYINESTSWAGAMPAVALGLIRAFHADASTYANAAGMAVLTQTAKGCLVPKADPGLDFHTMLKPAYQDWQHVPFFVKVFNSTIMGRGPTPREPLLMTVGSSDGTGDGVMVAKDVQQLAYEYCRRGVPVDFKTDKGLNHTEAALSFLPRATAFLNARMHGRSTTTDCSSTEAGNPLTPLPAH